MNKWRAIDTWMDNYTTMMEAFLPRPKDGIFDLSLTLGLEVLSPTPVDKLCFPLQTKFTSLCLTLGPLSCSPQREQKPCNHFCYFSVTPWKRMAKNPPPKKTVAIRARDAN